MRRSRSASTSRNSASRSWGGRMHDSRTLGGPGSYSNQEAVVIISTVAGPRLGQHQGVGRVDVLLPPGICWTGLRLEAARDASHQQGTCQSEHGCRLSDDILPRIEAPRKSQSAGSAWALLALPKRFSGIGRNWSLCACTGAKWAAVLVWMRPRKGANAGAHSTGVR